MKVVINSQFGGFALSPLAVKRLAELGGKKCFFFFFEPHPACKWASKFHRVSLDKAKANPCRWAAFSVLNPNFILDPFVHPAWDSKGYNDAYASIYLTSRPENRADPLLVKVVEELGHKADGYCASLKVVDIPDGIEWGISDYDGMETIEENHRFWC